MPLRSRMSTAHVLGPVRRSLGFLANAVKTMNKHKQVWQVIRDVINAWGPYGFAEDGQTDEYDPEVTAITKQIPRIRSRNDAKLAVSRVFSSYFEPKRFAPDKCADVGAKLFAALETEGLITASDRPRRLEESPAGLEKLRRYST